MATRVDVEYGVETLNKRQAAKTAPHAYQTRTQPSTYKVGGKSVSPGWTHGGNMNGGGKRRGGKLN